MSGLIAVVDDANRFLRWEPRRVVHEHQFVHRSAYVLVFDRTGRVLVQRRHRDKLTYPSHWDVSCAGHVEESDYPAGPDDDLDAVYAAVAARELEEELGIAAPLEPLGRFGPEPGVHYEWMYLFSARSDGPFVLQVEEVEEHRLLSRAEARALIAGPEPTTRTLRWLVDWLDRRDLWPA